ncbi:MAG: cupin domain-containing protein [bacterium]|nr:cupin domain-containing protein [bacterium]MDE0668510.1 cupin domain-containing protein [bacterium]MXZ30699.1 cupin domain-containing protein [Acidimicrobiia bacterium]MYB23541.1 cupin domain-containing protein [Acidimicrobiia bacterium]
MARSDTPEFVTRAETTPPDDLSGTAFAHLDVRTLVSDARQGSEQVMVGRTVYPGGGGTHEHHLHPDAEEVVIVLSGRGWHRVGDAYYEIGPGDVVFVPANTAHSAGSVGAEDMVILWVLGGVPSLEQAGYQSVPEIPGIPAG